MSFFKPVLLACACASLVAGCSSSSTGSAAQTAPEPGWVEGARDVAMSVPPKLVSKLTATIDKSGPAQAVEVCKEDAPKMARAASEQSGWTVRRVSLKNRNPKAVPDAWERETLEQFDRQRAAGADPADLERWTLVTENGQTVRRYMKALPTGTLCLQCHGPADKLGQGVAERLATLYPQDKATGYALGQIRGAMTLSQPVR